MHTAPYLDRDSGEWTDGDATPMTSCWGTFRVPGPLTTLIGGTPLPIRPRSHSEQQMRVIFVICKGGLELRMRDHACRMKVHYGLAVSPGWFQTNRHGASRGDTNRHLIPESMHIVGNIRHWVSPLRTVSMGLITRRSPVRARPAPPLSALIEGQGEKTLVDITVDTDGDGTGDTTITATDGHPFWVESTQEWRDAIDLRPTNLLRTSAGTWVQVTAVATRTESATVHNLTVDDLHTYHVAAGEADVLVHNTNPNCVKTGLGDNRAKFKDHYLDHRDILQKHLGKQYPKWKKDKGKEFLDDLHKMMTTGRLQYQGLGTLKKGQEVAHIFRGEGLTVVVDQRGNFWTLLKSGTGMDKGIVMLLWDTKILEVMSPR